VLTRALVSVLAAGLAAVLMLAAGQQAALAGRALPPLFTTAVAAFRVAESQALNTAAEPDARRVPARPPRQGPEPRPRARPRRPQVLQASAGREKRRSADQRRAVGIRRGCCLCAALPSSGRLE